MTEGMAQDPGRRREGIKLGHQGMPSRRWPWKAVLGQHSKRPSLW